MPNFMNAAILFLAQAGRGLVRILQAQYLLHRVQPAAVQPDAAHVQNDVPLGHQVGADVLVAVAQRRLQLVQRDAVTLEPVGIGVDFIALDRAAGACDVHDVGHAAELALEHPVL